MKAKIKVTQAQYDWILARGNKYWTAVVMGGAYPHKNMEARIISLHNAWDSARHEAVARNSATFPNNPARAVKRVEFLEIFEMVVED